MNPIPGLIALIMGSGLLYSSVKNKNVVYVFRYALSGKNPATAPATGKKPDVPDPGKVGGGRNDGVGGSSGSAQNPSSQYGAGGSDLLPPLTQQQAQQNQHQLGLTPSSYYGGSDPIST